MKQMLLLLLLLCTTIFSEPDIYEFPYSSGARHISMGYTGGAYATGPASAHYNPALLSEVGRKENIQILSQVTYEPTAPSLGLDISTKELSFTYCNYDKINNFDWGVQTSWERTKDFFKYDIGSTSSLYNSEVLTASLSTLYKRVLGVGLTLESMSSKYLNEKKQDKRSNATTVTVGLLCQKEIHRKREKLFTPAIGLTLRGIGNNTINYDYSSTHSSVYRLPRDIRIATAATLTHNAKTSQIFAADMTKPLTDETTMMYSLGHSIQCNPLLNINHGFFMDKNQKRKEYNVGMGLQYNYQKFAQTYNKKYREDFNILFTYDVALIFTIGGNDVLQNQFTHDLIFGFSYYPSKINRNVNTK